MSEDTVKNASFSFERYFVEHSYISLNDSHSFNGMKINIEPEGSLDENNNIFTLSLTVTIKDNDGNIDFNMSIKGFFKYSTDDMDRLLKFISYNAPAIMFPYIRAYISSITALSGIQSIVVPTLNMMSVSKKLHEQMVSKIGK